MHGTVRKGQLLGQTLIRLPKKSMFPSLGEDHCIYVDESEEIMYLWDNKSLTYMPIASDWHQIKVINGGNA